MTPEQLIATVGSRTGSVPNEIALRAVRMARARPAHVQLREGDHPVRTLSPDAVLVIDASCCVVLVTPERRVTVTDLDGWAEGVVLARQFQRIYLDGAVQS